MAVLKPGRNIAIKVPAYKWDETVAFYRDRVGLRIQRDLGATVFFDFGEMNLALDRVETQSQVDVWLELTTHDLDDALANLESPIRDSLEPLDGVDAHWTCDPAGTVLLVRKTT
jgi:catechol 2,3-dioxygenase-like lactoylglutathione lyase family enzyme